MRRIALWFYLLVLAAPVTADGLVRDMEIAVPMGRGEHEIGVDEGGGERWMPLFFAVDEGERVYIPDFYNGRIAVFDGDGSLSGAVSIAAGISPRMNYFDRTDDGRFVTFDDGALYLLSRDGEVLWSRRFAAGMIPRTVVAADEALFVVFPQSSVAGRGALVFDYASPEPTGWYGTSDAGRPIPLIRSRGRDYALTLSDMPTVRGDGFRLNDFDATFLAMGRGGDTLWHRREGAREYIYLVDPQGGVVHDGVIPIEGELAGSGFWTAIGPGLRIWKAYYDPGVMRLVAYRFGE